MNLKLYVDGIYVGANNKWYIRFIWTNSDKIFRIGTRDGRYANGKIAICKVYNRALTADEVQQNYIAHKARFSS